MNTINRTTEKEDVKMNVKIHYPTQVGILTRRQNGRDTE
jgi:hypothetical protein